jgi:hypothetical protein
MREKFETAVVASVVKELPARGGMARDGWLG